MIGAVTRDAFGCGVAEARPLTEGWFNTAYALRLDGPPHRALLKVGPADGVPRMTADRGLMRAEIEMMRHAAASGVPMPDVLWTDLSRRHAPHDLMMQAWLDGVTWWSLEGDLAPGQTHALERATGGIARTLAHLRGDAFGPPTLPPAPTLLGAVGAMLDALLADADRFGVVLPSAAARLPERLARDAWAFHTVTEPRFVHGDLWQGNVLVHPEDAALVGVIDSERALWGDPLMELIYRFDERHRAFALGRALSPAEETRRLYYDVMQDLTMVAEDGPRQYADKTFVEMARRWLARDLDRLSAHG